MRNWSRQRRDPYINLPSTHYTIMKVFQQSLKGKAQVFKDQELSENFDNHVENA
jgi:hypothetical protein